MMTSELSFGRQHDGLSRAAAFFSGFLDFRLHRPFNNGCVPPHSMLLCVPPVVTDAQHMSEGDFYRLGWFYAMWSKN